MYFFSCKSFSLIGNSQATTDSENYYLPWFSTHFYFSLYFLLFSIYATEKTKKKKSTSLYA